MPDWSSFAVVVGGAPERLALPYQGDRLTTGPSRNGGYDCSAVPPYVASWTLTASSARGWSGVRGENHTGMQCALSDGMGDVGQSPVV